MSGGHFDYMNTQIGMEMENCWHDPVINELFHDLFCSHNYGDTCGGCGGLAHVLDYWLSGDICEEEYREAVEKFKRKWFGSQDTCKEVIERYIDEKVEELKAECLGRRGE